MFTTAFRTVVASALVTAFVASGAAARMLNFGDLQIINPTAHEAKAGSNTRLTMGLANDGPTTVYVVAITSPVAAGARFRLNAGDNEIGTAIEAISVPGGGRLGLGLATIWIELLGLQRNLNVGERFPISLHFANGAVATIDVGVEPKRGRSLSRTIGG